MQHLSQLNGGRLYYGTSDNSTNPAQEKSNTTMREEEAEKPKPSNHTFDGKRFLDHLRESGTDLSSAATIGRNNTSAQGPRSTGPSADLQSLFEEKAPSPRPPAAATSLQPDMEPAGTNTATTQAPPSPLNLDYPPQQPQQKLPSKPQHDRNVSWGANQEHPPPNSPRSHLDRNTSVGSSISSPTSSNNASPYGLFAARKQPQPPQHTRTGTLSSAATFTSSSINEVSPFEAEVETAILKHLDEQSTRRLRAEMSTRRFSGGAASNNNTNIFSQVPDSAAHDFELSQSTSNDEMPQPNSQQSLNDSQQGSTDSKEQQHRPLLRASAKPPPRSTRHLRKESVEQTLFDLTEAMTALHKRGTSSSGKPPVTTTTSPKNSVAGGTAQEFAQNAVHISEQQGDLNNGGSSGVPGSSSDENHAAASTNHRWGLIKGMIRGEELAVLREENRNESTDSLAEQGESKGQDEKSGDDTVAGNMSEEDGSGDPNNINDSEHSGPNNPKRGRKHRLGMDDKLKEDWQKWSEFFRPHKGRLYAYIKNVTLYLLIPLIGVAAILFYLAGNVPTGTNGSEERVDDDEGMEEKGASASYILLFTARLIITLSLALAIQFLVIDVVALQTRFFLRTVGPVITLLIVQSKGWPHIVFWWVIGNFSMNYGDHAFAHHWAFYQDFVDLFNSTNPSGAITYSDWYRRCLVIGISVSIVVTIKRFLIGLYLGRKQFSHYGELLGKVLNKMLLVSEVARLAKFIEKTAKTENTPVVMPSEVFSWNQDLEGDDGDTVGSSATKSFVGASDPLDFDVTRRDALTGSLHFSEKLKLMQILEQWEEPALHTHASDEIASISAVLRFRKALTFIQQRYPFSFDFGAADTRETCIESSQKVFYRLISGSSESVLQFETIALMALDDDGLIDQQKAKDLVKLFRPDREGKLTMLEFIQSVDSVYKEYRMLQATIENSTRIDQAFENLFNVVFYVVVATVILSQLGFDPLALFLSLSSFILAFAFMIGSASSKYFEGILFILARRPYGIGDKISVGNSETNASLHGALPWVVENVTLFETVVCFLPTNERASLSNGALANSRIINWARSPQAQFHIFLNFPLNTPYEKVVIFKGAIEEYMKARPREWRALNGFRANQVVANQNYIEWLIVIQHREAWQEVGKVLDSKANLNSYCQEVARQLDMEYQAPRLPVELRYAPSPLEEPLANEQNRARSDSDLNKLTQEFQSIARNKHNIRVC